MAITVDILPGGPRRVSADVSYGDGAAAGPIIPIRWMVQRRTDKDLLIRMQQMLHLQPEHSAPGIVPIPATPAELDILLKQLRAWGGIVSPTARAAFARSAASGHGLMELGFIAVLPPVQELETTTVEEAMDAGRFFAHCCNEGCPVHATLRCTGCRGASYCSSDCQKKAWRTHKAHCGTPEQRQERQAKAAAIGPPKDEAPSVLVSINKGLPKELGHVMIGLSLRGGPSRMQNGEMPLNINVAGRFLVKVQAGDAGPSQPMMVYDCAKSIQFMVAVPDAVALYDLVKAERMFAGRKAYVYAKREGDSLRLFLKSVPAPDW